MTADEKAVDATTIARKLREAYHNDLTDVPILLDAADEISRLQAELDEARAAYIKAAEAAHILNDRLAERTAEVEAMRTALIECVTALEEPDYRFSNIEYVVGRARAALNREPSHDS